MALGSFKEPFLANKDLLGIMADHEWDSHHTVNETILSDTFSVRTFRPLLLTHSLLHHLPQAASPKIGLISSRGDSIGDNTSGVDILDGLLKLC